MNKEKDWVFSLERQIVNNLKQQITNLDVNNILHYHQTGEVREVSYVPIVSNSLVYLWNEVEERVANSFFSNGLDLAEFNKYVLATLEIFEMSGYNFDKGSPKPEYRRTTEKIYTKEGAEGYLKRYLEEAKENPKNKYFLNINNQRVDLAKNISLSKVLSSVERLEIKAKDLELKELEEAKKRREEYLKAKEDTTTEDTTTEVETKKGVEIKETTRDKYNKRLKELKDKKDKLESKINGTKDTEELKKLKKEKSEIDSRIFKLKNEFDEEITKKIIEKELEDRKKGRSSTETPEQIEAENAQKEAEKQGRKQKYNPEELDALSKGYSLDSKLFVKPKKFKDSPYMKTRLSNLSKLLDSNLKIEEGDKESIKEYYRGIVEEVNDEMRGKQYTLKQELEKKLTTRDTDLKESTDKLVKELTGGIGDSAFKAQVLNLLKSKEMFSIEKLNNIYERQLRNPKNTEKKNNRIRKLVSTYVETPRKAKALVNKVERLKNRQSQSSKVERIIVTEMTAAYNIATFLSNPEVKYFKWSIEPEHERRNAVCLVCYERANGGYLNKGVYPRDQIEANVELFIPKHPYCLCRYIPITQDTNPDLFALIEGMSPDQKKAYEQAMDNWVNLSNNWSKLGTVTKGAALTALSVASLWLAAKRFKKLGETIEKGSKGFIKLRDRFMGEGDIGRSPQQVVNAITREGGILPQRPQYGLGEVDQINPQNVEAVIQDTNKATQLLLEGLEQEKPQILKTVLSSVGAGVKVADLPNEVLESMEVAELLAVDKAERNYMTAPLDVEIEGVKPEHQDFPLEELVPNKGTDYLPLKYDYPTLNNLALQAVNQFERNHSKEIIELGDILKTLRGYNIEEIVDEGVLNGYIEDLIKTQKKINSLLRELPNEVLSSKNARDNNRKMTFYLEGNDVKFPFKGKGQINKAIGFVAEIEKGEKSGIIGQNTVSHLVETVEELKALRTQAENRKLRILETEGTRDLQNEKVFYDPETLTLKKAENVEPLPPTTLTREAFVDNVLLVGDTFNYLGVKREDKELLNFLEDLYSANKYVKTVQSLDKQKYSVKQIKEYLVSQPDLPVNIGSKFNSIGANSQKILKYIASEKTGLETQIKELESLLNSVSIKVKDKVDIKESDIKEQIQIALNKLRLRHSFLTEKAEIIKDFNKLKDTLVNDQTSYMNKKYRLSELETLDQNLQPVQKTFRTTQLKITDLKKKIADLITEQQTLTDRKKIDEIENRIKVLTEEIRKVQIAEFRRYEIEKNNNYIQYLSVRDNVLFSRIFREKLKR